MSDESKKIRPGDVLELEIVDVGGTGVFIARHDGQVVFVRHAAVGEVVRAEVTVVNKNFLRADTVEVIKPSPNRVAPPCSLAGVCGGCDYQHLELSAQREIKSALLRNTLQHVGRIDAIAGRGLGDFAVEPLVDNGDCGGELEPGMP